MLSELRVYIHAKEEVKKYQVDYKILLLYFNNLLCLNRCRPVWQQCLIHIKLSNTKDRDGVGRNQKLGMIYSLLKMDYEEIERLG